MIDEAASRLRIQQESKPEEIENLDRDIIKMKIEIQALKKETDLASKERLVKLQKELTIKKEECERLTQIWKKEKEEISITQRAKEKLEKARIELEQAQRVGDLEKASELLYGIIPALEKQIKERENISDLT